MTFKYRVIGGPDAALIISTQLIPLHAISTDDVTDEEAADWVIPTIRRNIASSKSEALPIHIPIGEVGHPTRIRIECHPGRSSKNSQSDVITECFIDDIRLTQCDGG